jgi:hypothetical protein
VKRVGMTTDRHDGNSAVVKLLFPGARFRRISQKFRNGALRRCGVATRADLDCLDAETGELVEHLIQRKRAERRVEDANRQLPRAALNLHIVLWTKRLQRPVSKRSAGEGGSSRERSAKKFSAIHNRLPPE